MTLMINLVFSFYFACPIFNGESSPAAVTFSAHQFNIYLGDERGRKRKERIKQRVRGESYFPGLRKGCGFTIPFH